MVGNAIAGLKWLTEYNPTPRHIIGTSSDIPTVTSAIVEDLIQTCTPFDHDLYYTVVTQDVMEKRFPHSKRTYVQFKDLHVAGGDMFIFKTSLVTANPELMEAMSNSRKHAWKLARIVGLRTLIKYLFHRLSLQEVEQAGGRLIDGTVKTVLFPQAELAMDADKADQVKLLQREFQGDTGS
jgi:hypothetical protein